MKLKIFSRYNVFPSGGVKDLSAAVYMNSGADKSLTPTYFSMYFVWWWE